MGVIDRGGRLAKLLPGGDGVLELGCGPRKRLAHAIGVDARDLPAVDVVGDVFDVLREVPDGSLREIHSSHFLEHVEPLERFLHEAVRVLRPGGRLCATVPHFSNPYFYSDPTHRTHFGLYTFSYYAHDRIFARRVPHYANLLPLRLARVRLGFRSPKVFPVRNGLKRALGALVNLGAWSQELYEENLCFWLPCYEIEFELEREAS